MAEIHSGPEAIAIGVERLSQGKTVAFPTETVYGLGADALDSDAVQRVFDLKGRPSTNPLIVHVSGHEMAQSLVTHWSDEAQLIVNTFWPGPLTLVLPKADCVPSVVCAQGDTVAIRCPEHPLTLALIESFGKPIVGPSANPSGRISPTSPEHVASGFHEQDVIILDGGYCRAGIESTVLDLSGDECTILRLGVIGAHAISQVINREVRIQDNLDQSNIARSPGLLGAHYQPLTPTKLFENEIPNSASSQDIVIAWAEPDPNDGQHIIKIPSEPTQYAQHIYRALHEADGVGAQTIFVQTPKVSTNPDEQAVRDAILERLHRAAHSCEEGIKEA